MESFLEKVIKHIDVNLDASLSECCFIVPNQRTALFLKKYLAATKQNSMVLPSFYTISEFTQMATGINNGAQLTLLTTLYKAYTSQIEQEGSVAFAVDDFMNWGHMLLQDFSLIDVSMANAEDVFDYINEAKAMSLWNPENSKLTPLQKNYLKFYNALYPVYKSFTNSLLEKGFAYQAFILRHLAENLHLLEKAAAKWAHLFFVGFNALTKAESVIIDYLHKVEKASVFFDYDDYFTKSKELEAGYFIRKNIEKYGQSPFQKEIFYFLLHPKDVHIMGVPQNIGQARLAGHILTQYVDAANASKVAVVLPDEHLLFPMLNAIPQDVNAVNVTMGYPLKKTLVYELFNDILKLYDNAFRITKMKEAQVLQMNIKDFLCVIENPCFRAIYSTEDAGVTSFIKQLKSRQKVFYDTSSLSHLVEVHKKNHSTPAWRCIEALSEHQTEGPLEMTLLLKKILKELVENSLPDIHNSNNRLEIECMYQYSKTLNTLIDFLNTTEGATLRSLKYFIELLFGNEHIPFSGDPLKGLQLMGLLESRNLDFETVIILSCNEGVLPPAKHHNSFIPFDIKRQFQIPIYKDNEAIFAYHFYRLLMRAKNIYLIYNTETDEMGSGGEKSRFVTQLLNQWPAHNSDVSIKEYVVAASSEMGKNDGVFTVHKTEDLMALIKEKALHGFSPSSLAVFLQCGLKFYLQYLLNLKAEDAPDEHVDAAVLGSAVHDVLENIYNPFAGQKLKAENLDHSEKMLESLLRQAFQKSMKHPDLDYGKNHLLFKLAKKYIKNYLQYEKAILKEWHNQGKETTLLGTEVQLSHSFKMDIGHWKDCKVFLKGKVDRLDKVGHVTRIVDYKTGRIDRKDLTINDWSELTPTNNVSQKVIQLLIYGFLYYRRLNVEQAVEPGFISLRMPASGLFHLKLPKQTSLFTNEVHSHTEAFVSMILKEIFDMSKPFQQTSSADQCKYCDFSDICNRK